jgi:hypothetical protein
MNHRYRVFFYDLLFIILVAVFSFFVGCFVGAYIDRNRYKGLNINAQSKEESEQIQKEEKYIPPLYVQAIQGTIIDPFLLRAIAIVESGECDSAIGDGGLSHGRFQLYSVYHNQRVQKYGSFDPFNPNEAGKIAARYLEECYLATGNLYTAVAAYRQGVGGVRKNGIQGNYVNKVMRIYFSFYKDETREGNTRICQAIRRWPRTFRRR